MPKRLSLSTEDGGEHSILIATFPSLEKMLRLVVHHLRGSTSRRSSGKSNICPVHFSEFVLMVDDLRAFFPFWSLFFYFLHGWCCIWWQIIKARVKIVHVNRRVTRSRVYVIRIFDFWDQFNISGGRAAIVFIAMLTFFAKTRHIRARLTARQLNENCTRPEHNPNECWLTSTIAWVKSAAYCVLWFAVNCGCGELTVLCASL